ncbi:uncharacterized protein FOMMEDRAFT_21737 [Fomitiporia mediterranea MF3/22]|uniref:uncharacterized protein n=1 Tax=Fomitiporia mediterranea (strain MF3/22) TaxID=694068 RepID=UPI0004408363|nr:uncharacterized protein FOMMEDRAFT_21737 [Fomitiporia mediterranea MF3/22]EJD01331.1 hypothetical protein FOMMEDRAFT_21737 [Fomitiporia mediterranea MF3/22]
MPLGIPKFFTRKNSGRRSKKQPPVVASRVLSPVSEHSVISVPASDAPRPVPPPQHFSAHPSDYGHHDDYHDDLHEPHSRLYETFTMSEDSRPPVPMVVREDDEDAHLHHVPGSYADEPLHHQRHLDDYPDVHQTDLTNELGYTNTDRSGHDRPILIAPSSERSASTQSGSQKVTFLGDAPSRPRGMPMSHSKSLSATSRSMAGDRPRAPYVTSSHRSDYNRPRRQIPEYLPSLHRAPRREGYYQQKLPYMIFVDQGHGLEVGNDEDGFMPYQEYLATAHLRRTEEHTYYIIPGSTPVIFNDENGRELYRVDAQKYNTSYLRRNRYIVEDEYGNELCRIGHFGENSSDTYSSRSRSPKVVYVNAERGRQARNILPL